MLASALFGACFACNLIFSLQVQFEDVLFIILSQNNPFHLKRADDFVSSIRQQSSTSTKPTINLIHEYGVNGAWTILPILSKINDRHHRWIVFCEEITRFDVTSLIELLDEYSSDEDWFIGHALKDEEPTIIHHFDQSGLKYPNFGSGFVLSRALLSRLKSSLRTNLPVNQFSIDPKYEFALYVTTVVPNSTLTDRREFCIERTRSDCVSFVSETFPNCGDKVSDDSFSVAVKTYSGFYETRVKSVFESWGRFVENLSLFGDERVEDLPIIDLGIPNVESGHCAKTLAIMEYYSSGGIPDGHWLAIVDDDTILSVSRLKRLLSCYDAGDHVAIGERYGYGFPNGGGYDYITGGGGMVFSMKTVRRLVVGDACACPRDDSPDDMIIGMCLRRFDIPVVHSPAFHQARHGDYSSDYLSTHRPVSFHKHWMIDPVRVYDDWFRHEDLEGNPTKRRHDEL